MGYHKDPEVRLQVQDSEAVLVIAGILAEAGAGDTWYSPGGNEVVFPEANLALLNAEQRAEVAKLSGGALPPTDAPAPPGSNAGAAPTGGSAGVAPPSADEPPRSGAGSGRDAWAAYATSKGITVPADAGRDQIIELVEAQR